MNRQKLTFLSVLLLLYSVVPSHAVTYYVNNSGSTACSNTPPPGHGTQANPFCTITYGISRMIGGDTLNVQAGIYAESVDITGPAGTAGQHTVIQTYPPGASVTIQGASTAHGRVKIELTSYVDFIGFMVNNWNQGIFVEAADHILVQNCTVSNVGVEGIHVHWNSSFVTVNHCTVHDTGQLGTDGEGFYVGTGDALPVDNTNNVIVKNSTVFKVTSECIELKIGTHDIVVDGNDFSQCNTVNNGYGGAGIEVNQAVGSTQHWDSNPNHIIRNNKIHDTGIGTGGTLINSGMRLGTGATAYNNVIWNVNASGDGIFTDNQSSDSYTRKIYHNTVDLPSSRAIINIGGSVDIQNNIGPPSAGNNLTTSISYFVNEPGRNYHLAAASSPIDAGANLTSVVPTDIEGNSRSLSGPPDIGAYEYVTAMSAPSPPTNLTGIVR
jgi:hypothetical protein